MIRYRDDYEDNELNRLHYLYYRASLRVDALDDDILSIDKAFRVRPDATAGMRAYWIRGREELMRQKPIVEAERERARLAFNARVQVVNDENQRKYEEAHRVHLAQLQFSKVHDGDQPYPHVDGNRRVDGRKTGDKSGHHQEQSPGYGREPIDIPVRVKPL